MKKSIIIAAGSLLFLIACKQRSFISNAADYSVFMKEGLLGKEAAKITEELSFWQQRLQRDTGNYVDMLELANCHLRLFKTTGEANHLRIADSLLVRSSYKLRDKDPDILFALSQTSITQHQFRNAIMYNNEAGKADGSKYTNSILEFDAGMELGQYHIAASKLASLKDKTSFDYLIRKSKLEDHRGNLDGAIELMEQAFAEVKDKSAPLYCWALSNLGDMYGHAGRIKEAYHAYLNVLRKDSSYVYALKGIAWIVYSHDNNTTEAKRILNYILSQTKMPDLWLTLAEIEEWESNETNKRDYIKQFIQEVTKAEYGAMYNKYLIALYTEEFGDYDRALALAQKEVTERPTPETLDWLAWVYFNKGDIEKAYTLSRGYVYKQTHEPDATYHTALVFAANGKKELAKQMLEECLESAFEMGPVATELIRKKLASL